MKKWRIKTKKDWCITFLFAFLIFLVLAEYNRFGLREMLVRFYPDKMNYTCCPEWCSPFLIVTWGMAVFTAIVLILKKKSVKLWGSVIVIGIVLSVGAVFAFQYHCKLIVRTAEEFQPKNAVIYFDKYDSMVDLQGTDAKAITLGKMVYDLEELPEKEQEELRKKERNYETMVWVTYPEQYGQSFWLQCYVDGDEIYMKPEEGEPEVFYKDNGLLDYLEKLRKDAK